jgi:hypothetical protein
LRIGDCRLAFCRLVDFRSVGDISDGTRSVPTTIGEGAENGVHDEGFEVAGEGGEIGLSEKEAEGEAGVSGFHRLPPGFVSLAEVAVEAIGGDVLG